MHLFLVQHKYIITTVMIMYTPEHFGSKLHLRSTPERGNLLLGSHSSNCSGTPRSYWELTVSFHDVCSKYLEKIVIGEMCHAIQIQALQEGHADGKRGCDGKQLVHKIRQQHGVPF